MTMLGAGLLAGAALLTMFVVIAIARDRDSDDDDVNLKEYDDWERLRGVSPACRPSLPGGVTFSAVAADAAIIAPAQGGIAGHAVTAHGGTAFALTQDKEVALDGVRRRFERHLRGVPPPLK